MTPSSLTGAPKDLLDLHNIRLRPQPLPKWKDQGESSQKPGKIIEIVCICQCHMYINDRNRIIYIYYVLLCVHNIYIYIYIYILLDIHLIQESFCHIRFTQRFDSGANWTPGASGVPSRPYATSKPETRAERGPWHSTRGKPNNPNSNTRWYPIVS